MLISAGVMQLVKGPGEIELLNWDLSNRLLDLRFIFERVVGLFSSRMC